MFTNSTYTGTIMFYYCVKHEEKYSVREHTHGFFCGRLKHLFIDLRHDVYYINDKCELYYTPCGPMTGEIKYPYIF